MSVTMSWTNSRAGASMSASKTLSPSDEVVVEATNISVANGQTDKAVSFGGVDVSQVVAVWMHSDQAVTIETNSTNATGGNTISLAANVPLQWCTGAPFSNPLTQDITSTVYITNASGSTATVNLRVVQDGTP